MTLNWSANQHEIILWKTIWVPGDHLPATGPNSRTIWHNKVVVVRVELKLQKALPFHVE